MVEQAFFITNDEPRPFWEMARYVWRGLGYREPSIVVPYWLAYWVAWLTELLFKLAGSIVGPERVGHPTLTPFRVTFAGAHRYFDISRAKRHLGYKPPVSLDDAMRLTLASFAHMRNPDAPPSSDIVTGKNLKRD